MNSSLWHLDPSAEETASLWAARLDGSSLSAADRVALDSWLAENPAHRTLLSSYCQFSADLEQQLPLLEGIKVPSAESSPAPKTAQLSPWSHWPAWAGVALTAAAAVALVFWLVRPTTQLANVATAVAERHELTLADGTRVELNAQTAMAVDFSRAERHVRLANGQAFFTVTKDPSRPFIVETPGGSVRVTGTRFDVRAESGSLFEVTVAEGSVQARPAQANSPYALGAGDRLEAGVRGVVVHPLSTTELDDVLAWRHGQIVFHGTPLHEALARFARYHGRSLTATPAAANLKVGGRFSLDDLDGFLAGIEDPLSVRVTRDLNGTIQVDLRSEH